MGAYFGFLNYMGWFRIDPLEEEVGMDISRHKGSCYDMQAADEDHVKQLEASRSEMVEDRSLNRSRRGMKTSTENDMNAEATKNDRMQEPEVPADDEAAV